MEDTEVPTVPTPGHMPAILRHLPPELLTLALSELAVVDIAAFRATSKACRDIVDTGEGVIYEAVAKRQYGMDVPCTAGDSGIRVDTIRYADDNAGDAPMTMSGDTNEFTVHETDSRLATAIANQRTGSRFYQGADSWLELVKRKKQVNERWRTGMPKRTYITPQLGRRPDPEMGVWRFKVDPDRKLIAYSTMSLSSIGQWGLLLTTPTDPDFREAAPRTSPFATNAHPYSHIEYSNSHLIVIGRASLDVWKWTSGEADISRASSLKHLYSSPLPYRVSSYKARFPFLVAEAAMDSKVLLIDIRTGALVRAYDSDAAVQSYVELDKDTLFLANTSLYGIDRVTGRTVDFLNQAWYPAESSVVLSSQRWQAVHHSLDGEHLVAVGDGPELIWFRNYRQHFFADPPAGESLAARELRKRTAVESVVVLSYQYPLNEGSIIIDNLCVEDGRVVFTSREPMDFPAIVLFELCAWTSHTDFRKCSSTRLRVLSGAFPTGTDGISRVEMDSTAIYVTSRVSEDTSDRPDFEVPYPPAWDVWVWRDVSGAELCPIEHDLVYWGDRYANAVHADGSADVAHSPSMNELADDSRNNSIRIYDFTKDEDRELCHPDLPERAGGSQRNEQSGGPISMTNVQINHMLQHFAST